MVTGSVKTGAFLVESVSTYQDWVKGKQCGNKIQFHGPIPAQNYATVLEWVFPGDSAFTGMTAYECSWCGYWHIGHDVALPHVPKLGAGDADQITPEDGVRARRLLRGGRGTREADAVQESESGLDG